jgi:hypothetical protein
LRNLCVVHAPTLNRGSHSKRCSENAAVICFGPSNWPRSGLGTLGASDA